MLTPNVSQKRRATRRDRQVYVSHPVAFALLRALAPLAHVRIGRVVVINDLELIRLVLTEVPLDRRAPATTGADLLEGIGVDSGVPFAETDRELRTIAGRRLGPDGLAILHPQWHTILDDAAAKLRSGYAVDVVQTARELAAATAATTLGISSNNAEQMVDLVLRAARESVANQLAASRPGSRTRTGQKSAAADQLSNLMRPDQPGLLADLAETGRDIRLVQAAGVAFAVAAIATTVASMPRAAALAADLSLWPARDNDESACAVLAEQLLRHTAPTGLLPRVTADDAEVSTQTGRRLKLRAGDRLLMVTLNAARHKAELPGGVPAPPAQTRIVFGAGPRACPGAAIARAQVALMLGVFAPLQPRVVAARADRTAALPSWQQLMLKAQ